MNNNTLLGFPVIETEMETPVIILGRLGETKLTIEFTQVSPLFRPQRDNLLTIHTTLQDALTWLDETPAFDDYRRKVIACLRSTEKVLGMEQSRAERKR